jgi:hypothetical protein
MERQMTQIEVNDSTGSSRVVELSAGDILVVLPPVEVKVYAPVSSFESIQRVGDDLIFEMLNDSRIIIQGVYSQNSKGLDSIVVLADGAVFQSVSRGFAPVLSGTPEPSLEGFLALAATGLVTTMGKGSAHEGKFRLLSPSALKAETDSDGMVTLTGFVGADVDVNVVWPDGVTVQARGNADGAFWLRSSLPQPSGEILVTVKNSSGASSSTASLEYVSPAPIEVVLPDPPVITGLSDDTGVIGDAITSARNLTFYGAAESGVTVSVFINDELIGQATASALGSWTLDHSSFSLDDGHYTLSARATYPLGQSSQQSTPFFFTVDATIEAVSINAVSNTFGGTNNYSTFADHIQLAGMASIGVSVSLSVNGRAVGTALTGATGVWQSDLIDVSGVLGDKIEVLATSSDIAGNHAIAQISAVRTDASPTVLGMTDLFPRYGFVVQGDRAGDEFGFSVSSAGDINGDGFDDFIVGAAEGDDGGTSAGEAYVIFGRSDGEFGGLVGGRMILDTTNLPPSRGFVVQGDRAWDLLGTSVSLAGDVNGDGVRDVVIGARQGDDGGSNASEAYVIYGRVDGAFGTLRGGRLVLDTSTFSQDQGFVIQGDREGDELGGSVSFVNDVNGDGVDDIVVGARFGDDAGSDAGEAYVIFGRSDSAFGTLVNGRAVLDTSDLTRSQGFIMEGKTFGDRLGFSVSSAGDVNGDGVGDLIVGAVHGDEGGSNAGEAYVLFGRSDSDFGSTLGGRSVLSVRSLGSDQGFIIQGDASGDLLGFSVSLAGDVNGDRIDDLIVGARMGNDGGIDAGEAYVLFGRADEAFGAIVDGRAIVDTSKLAPDQGFIIQGAAAGNMLGWSVSAAGDVNNDGVDDVIVGARHGGRAEAGEAYVIFGRSDGPFGKLIDERMVIEVSRLTPDVGFIIRGDAAGDHLGHHVAWAGDVNNDGIGDVLVGARQGDDGGANAGEAYVIFGRAELGGGLVGVGSSAADFLGGSSVADSLQGGGGADVLLGFGGNDRLSINDPSFLYIDGGLGNDTLQMDGTGFILDFTSLVSGSVKGIEVIDMRGGGANTLILDGDAIASVTNGLGKLVVEAGDNEIELRGFDFLGNAPLDSNLFAGGTNRHYQVWEDNGMFVYIGDTI